MRFRTQLFLLAWYENGQQRGVYLSDVAYKDLAPEHRAHLHCEALNAVTRTNLIPYPRKRRKGREWVFLDK